MLRRLATEGDVVENNNLVETPSTNKLDGRNGGTTTTTTTAATTKKRLVPTLSNRKSSSKVPSFITVIRPSTKRGHVVQVIVLIIIGICLITCIICSFVYYVLLDPNNNASSSSSLNHPNFIALTLQKIRHRPTPGITNIEKIVPSLPQQHLRHPQENNNNDNTTDTNDYITTVWNDKIQNGEIGIYPPPYPQITRNDKYDTKEHRLSLSAEAIEMCTNTLWHTIETTTIVLPNDETFIHTGDIDDLWLRDSAAQIHPLMIPFFEITATSATKQSLIQMDPKLNRIVGGLITRHVQYIHHDPYANAFRIDNTYVFNEEQKRMGRHDLISTWNYELDSGCYTFRMFYYYYRNNIVNQQQSIDGSATKDYSYLLQTKEVFDSIEIMIDTWIAEQRHEDDMYPTTPALKNCLNCGKPYRYPGLDRGGKGTPTNSSAGLIWTGFRPSDDVCIFGYLIPANMFVVAVLEYIIEMISNPIMWTTITRSKKELVLQKVMQLQKDILNGIETYGIIEHDIYGPIYAYEVDGLGNYVLMDDANVPSLLSIPYLLGQYPHHYNETIYNNTRNFILSPSNQYYQRGTNRLTGPLDGIGSPHMEGRIPKNIWPMAMAMRGLVSQNVTEKMHIIEQLVQVSAGTHWMHESFDVANPNLFTRSWFCWSDSLFAELVMSVSDQCPLLTKKYKVLDWRDPIRVPGSIYAATD